ncbi:MAG TPA: histidine kinase dimerization/phospho-acceptor domain-containing protein [Kiritimatiellia bacterium]|nr:histidine kinase dimerization/phospho-acceptor domain-containing protein [Kiritimatiellia bacterium]HRZ13434.1 histidine kinase dimerization/phospho-acceptor domain-containing protein [Kiritimatiellia bacterium]HSA18926.1 histidine kinase dimerization/phospho-acceptor domain-containing protein [Kiritimatiellia bacterium]
MRLRLRSRVFLYLLALLFFFIAAQSVIYALVEYVGWLQNPAEPLAEGFEEVLRATILDLLLLLPLVLVAWWISGRVIAPVRTIAATADRIRAGRFSERIETALMPDDETYHLADTINAAFNRYEAAVQRLRRFSGDASHQLRTPIAAIRSLGEVALTQPRDTAQYRETVETMLSELERLTRIVDQLLQLSRLESGALRAQFAPVDLAEVIEKVKSIYLPLCQERGLSLEVRAKPGLLVTGSEELLVELLGNLLDNAIRHAAPGGTVRLSAERRGDSAALAVRDDGPGIPTEFAERIFERFASVPGGRPGRAGLGLALAADIAAAHDGQLALVNPGAPGALFECVLPRRRD